MLNLAGFGPDEHHLLMQAGIEGLRDILALSLDDVPRRGSTAAAIELKVDPPRDLTIAGWWEQAQDARGRLTGRTRAAPRRRRHYHGRRGLAPLLRAHRRVS